MTCTKTTVIAIVFSALAAPAMANGFSFDLPRLTFPTPTPPVTTQDCTNPTTLGSDICTAN